MTLVTFKEISREKSNGANSRPQISGENIVWVSNVFNFLSTTYGREIFLDNGRDVIQLNDDSKFNASPVISGNKVAWCGTDSNGDRQVFYYNGEETIKISQEKHRNLSKFQIFENSIVKNVDFGNDKNIEMVVNNKSTIQLAGMPCFPGSLSPRCNRDIRDNYSPQISGENVVWENDGNLFLYNGKETIQVDDFGRDVRGFSVQISDDNVVWTGVGAKGNSEIFLYNGKETIQLTDNDVTDKSPQISGKNIVWMSDDGWNEIFLYNGKETIQLTDNRESSEIDPRIDVDPKIDGNRVVWHRFNMADGTASVILATINYTNDLSTPNRDRQLFTSSTIVVLSFISLCWLIGIFGKQ